MAINEHVKVVEELPFDPDSHLYGSKSVASLDRGELKGLALRVWQEDKKHHFIDYILLADIKELAIDNRIVYYAVAEAYQGR